MAWNVYVPTQNKARLFCENSFSGYDNTDGVLICVFMARGIDKSTEFQGFFLAFSNRQ